MLFDSHSHINEPKFDMDRDDMMQRAVDIGVSYILNPGYDLTSSEGAVNMAHTYDMVYAAVGIHPHDADTCDDAALRRIAELAGEKKVVAIGEIGLDYHYDNSPRDLQRDAFRRQIALAKSLNLPIIIHSRDADGETFDILKEEDAYQVGVLLHCYSGSAELAARYVKEGAYISIAGPVTYKNARKTVETVEQIALDRLMIETDAPYLTPVPNRGKRNEPANVHYTCQKVADIKGISYDEVARVTAANGKRFFGIK